MTTAQEICRRHGIDYLATKSGKFTVACPNCSGAGYLNCKEEKDGIVWFCHQCDFHGGEKYDQRKPQEKLNRDDLGPVRAIYDYVDEGGKLLFQALRFEPPGQPKQFRQRTGPDQKNWSIKGVRIVPYRLPELVECIAAGRVCFVVEGEKDCNALHAAGVCATTNPMGAGKWREDFAPIFNGADVVVCGDNDKPGREHALKVASMLKGVAARVRMLDLAQFWSDIQPSQDISDWLESGHDVERLWHIVEDLPDWTPPTNGAGATESRGDELRVLSRAEFLDGFKPPDYLVQGILQRHFIYSLTGQTGHAKTAVALLLAQLVGCTDPFASLGTRHVVKKGRVIYFAGENSDDVRMRVIGASAYRSDDPERDNIWFIDGRFSIQGMMHRIAENCRSHGEASLIIVDTSAAYFLFDDEQSNTQMGNYARLLRELTKLPGRPCVLVLCHPVKHVDDAEKLLPRGGGAYLAEVDGNLTLWKKTDDTVELSYNKMRGPGFQPMMFRLDTIKTPKLTDSDGMELPTVMAVALTDQEAEKLEKKSLSDEDRVLAALLATPLASFAALAQACNFLREGQPYKQKVDRILQKLAKPGNGPALTKKMRNRFILTEEGKTVAREAALAAEREAEMRNR